jgi:hypothetical protein
LVTFEREVSNWTTASITEQSVFTSSVIGDNRAGVDHTREDTGFFETAAALPPEQARSGARVPEPATLIFVGTGLIGIATVTRRLKPNWKFRTVTAQIQSIATQEA